MNEDDIKTSVRERDGYRCVDCGMGHQLHREQFGRGLQVHRLAPGSPYTIEGCITLCRPCHEMRHAEQSRQPRPGRKGTRSTAGWKAVKVHPNNYERLREIASRYGGHDILTALAVAIVDYHSRHIEGRDGKPEGEETIQQLPTLRGMPRPSRQPLRSTWLDAHCRDRNGGAQAGSSRRPGQEGREKNEGEQRKIPLTVTTVLLL
jgi:hypothetical protein